MRLRRLRILASRRPGGLLDGYEVGFRLSDDVGVFSPFCLVGPNGAGKSQVLQVIAEICQSLVHAVDPELERVEANPGLLFELEYWIRPDTAADHVKVRVTRVAGQGP